jgi:hypothetical protein
MLYRENIFFRFAEHTFLGVAAGVNFVMAMQTLRGNTIAPIIKGNMIYLVGLLLGISILLRYIKPTKFISDWSMAFYVGTLFGLQVSRLPITRIITPLKSFFIIPNNLDNIILILGFYSVLSYFIFGRVKNKSTGKIKGYLDRVGRIFIMVTLGAIFGSSLMGRFAMVIERIYFTLRTLGIVM